MKYQLMRDVRHWEGSQTFEVQADTLDEAGQKFIKGEGDIVEHDVEVTALFEIDLNEIYSALHSLSDDHAWKHRVRRSWQIQVESYWRLKGEFNLWLCLF